MELGKHATIEISNLGRFRDVVDRDLVDELFALGLLIAMTEGPPVAKGKAATLTIALRGRGRFMVGQEDLGTKRGLKILARGVMFALRAASEGVQPAGRGDPPATADTMPARPERDRPHTVEMPVEQALAQLNELVARVRHGTRVVLTDGGDRLAVLVGWSWYAQQEERLAAAAAAYWKAWRKGQFDTAVYAKAMRAAGLHPTAGLQRKVDDRAAPGVGGHDDDAR
ncbi:MAG: type II toxin-antitoxin system prevent-host-death family antitoxin [Cellulomonadaceae bacterium]|nr:type II toxin-antitoxin system prevent-host-death family antitoxin [Cellulomonadaceae bacterium]